MKASAQNGMHHPLLVNATPMRKRTLPITHLLVTSGLVFLALLSA
jgi:hypothetical protein